MGPNEGLCVGLRTFVGEGVFPVKVGIFVCSHDGKLVFIYIGLVVTIWVGTGEFEEGDEMTDGGLALGSPVGDFDSMTTFVLMEG